MTLNDDLIKARDAIVASNFAERQGQDVPATEDVGFNQAVKVSATYLYADMVDSSGLVAISPKATVGKVLRLYLDLSVRIIRHEGGHIRSFDGDRVMGIFMGDNKADRAVRAAMKIKWVCDEIIQPDISTRYQSIRNARWKLKPGTGIASGDAFIVRGGVRRSSSDLVSVGIPPNMAAKLSDLRGDPYHLRIGSGTYGALSSAALIGSNGTNMWHGTYTLKMGGQEYQYYRSSFRWKV